MRECVLLVRKYKIKEKLFIYFLNHGIKKLLLLNIIVIIIKIHRFIQNKMSKFLFTVNIVITNIHTTTI
jgi:hypothetical protein